MPILSTICLRWKKVAGDLWINRGRSLLAATAMTIGMIGISAVLCSYTILVRELNANYRRTNPAAAIIVADTVDDGQLAALQHMPGVDQVEARGLFRARILIGQNEWKPLLLFVIDDFTDMRISRVKPEQGQWPPQTGEMLIERAALAVARKPIGAEAVIRMPGHSERTLRISGSVHDPGQAPAWMEGVVYGYITRPTLMLLGGSSTFNAIYLTAAETHLDRDSLRGLVKSITNEMEGGGCRIQRVEVPEPGHHPHQSQLQALLFLLQVFGCLALVLSTILVVTLLDAIMARQVQQIGIMKAIGARTSQITAMYLGGALFLGLIAVAVGLPLGAAVARAYAGFAARMLNFTILDDATAAWAFGLLIAVGLITPVLSAAVPVRRSSRITVREAINDYGITALKAREGALSRVVARYLPVTRPLQLSLRNTFRRKGRMALTLGTLAIGGAMFISALNVGSSIKQTIRTFRNGMRFDLNITLSRPESFADLQTVIARVPGVKRVEGWASAKAALIYENGTDGNQFSLIAPATETDLIRPRVIQGRWLAAQDTDALVVNHIFMDQEPHLKLGDSIVLRLGEDGAMRRSTWRIVGVVRQVGPPRAFANPHRLLQLTGEIGLVSYLPVVTSDSSPDAHRAVAGGLEKALAQAGIGVLELAAIGDTQKVLEDHFLVLTMLLLFMAILIVIVGGLGLMTTMSIQVLERTREIGVMRAIGGSGRQIRRMIRVEGLIIGILSWGLASLLALLLGKFVSDVFGRIFLKTTLDYAVSPAGFGLWLALVIAFSLLACYWPARKATRLSVRETLAYE